jgi:hypothetical protein
MTSLIVGNSNSTQGILRLVTTGNVKCRSTDWIKRRNTSTENNRCIKWDMVVKEHNKKPGKDDIYNSVS